MILKPQPTHQHNLGQVGNFGDDILGNVLIHLNQGNGFPAQGAAAQMECGDVDVGLPQQMTDLSDIARFIHVANQDHAGGHGGL